MHKWEKDRAAQSGDNPDGTVQHVSVGEVTQGTGQVFF